MFVFTSREKIRQLTSFVSSICPGLDDAGYAACHDIEAKVAEKCEDKETTHGSCNCVAIGRGSVVSDVALQYQSKHEERPHDPLIRRRRGAHSPGSSNCELVTAPIFAESRSQSFMNIDLLRVTAPFVLRSLPNVAPYIINNRSSIQVSIQAYAHECDR